MLEKLLCKKRLAAIVLVISWVLPISSIYATETADERERIEKVKNDITRIGTKIHTDLAALKALASPPKKVVLAIGMTGEGKSTLGNFFAKKALKGLRRAPVYVVEADNPAPGMEIGHGASKTIDPHYWYDQATRTVYYDSPGFADTRNPSIDIVNAYTLQTLFQNLQTNFLDVRVMLAMSESTLTTPRSLLFNQIFGILGEFFGDQSGEFAKRVCLMVTGKNRFESAKEIREVLNRNLNENRDTLSPHACALISALVGDLKQESGSGSPVAFLPMPTETGPFLSPGTEPERRTRAEIQAALDRASVMHGIDCKLAVSDGTRAFAQKIANVLNRDVKDFISSDFTLAIYRHCNAVIAAALNLQTLREEFKALRSEMDKICDTNEREQATSAKQKFEFEELDLQKLMGGIKTVAEKCGIEPIYTELARKIGFVTFLRKVNTEIGYAFGDWIGAFGPVKAGVGMLKTEPQVSEPGAGGIRRLRGVLVGTSDIDQALRKHEGPVNRIDLDALNTLFIDQDVIKSSTSLSLFAPRWKVIGGKRTINLSGKAGNPGSNGGHLYGKGHLFESLTDLTIDVSGGNGNEGATGRKGEDGANGNDEEYRSKHEYRKDDDVWERAGFIPSRLFKIGGTPSYRISKIAVSCGAVIDYIELWGRWGRDEDFSLGRVGNQTGGPAPQMINLTPDEFIDGGIECRFDGGNGRLGAIRFRTNKGRYFPSRDGFYGASGTNHDGPSPQLPAGQEFTKLHARTGRFDHGHNQFSDIVWQQAFQPGTVDRVHARSAGRAGEAGGAGGIGSAGGGAGTFTIGGLDPAHLQALHIKPGTGGKGGDGGAGGAGGWHGVLHSQAAHSGGRALDGAEGAKGAKGADGQPQQVDAVELEAKVSEYTTFYTKQLDGPLKPLIGGFPNLRS